MDEDELLAELFRANDRFATIIRDDGSTATRIDGTFDLRKVADGFATVVRRPLTPTVDGLAYLHAKIRAARAAGQAVGEISSTAVGMRRQPTMDDGELLAEAFRANGPRLATITRAEGSEVTRINGTFNLKQIARVFSSLIKDRNLREIFLEAPRDPEEVLEELRNHVAPNM